ncbi:mechanosensitive ion channel family protein [Algoriphagus namhaensis]|uniref:Mechanosensitive ion channel family protein n=1 Tax=Algoriphagus namhaensis TaxID=915353 RepID=A0ABV8AT51_9BACT
MKDLFNISWESLTDVLITSGVAIGILLGFYFLANFLQGILGKRLVRRMDDPLLANFISVIFRMIIMIIGFMVVFRVVGLTGVVSGLLAGAGISAFVIGFALKDIGENFLAGILLAFKRPFRVGDVIDIVGMRGTVLAMNLRDTQIKTGDGKDTFIPNATLIKNPLTNFTIDGFLRYDFIIGLDYGSDYHKAMEVILLEVIKVDGVLTDGKKPNVWIADLAESTLNLQVTFWVDTFDRTRSDMRTKTEAIISVLEALEKAGFNLPSKIVELKNYQGNSLETT